MNTKNKSAVGAINDLSLAVEFTMAALRDLAKGLDVTDPQVQEKVGFAIRKIQHLQMVPKAGHIVSKSGKD